MAALDDSESDGQPTKLANKWAAHLIKVFDRPRSGRQTHRLASWGYWQEKSG